MTREEAETYAKTMTYEDALYNLSQARAIPYRKATFIKVNELIKALSQEPICDRDCEHCTWTECPIEPCDDAISRDAVIDLIKRCYPTEEQTTGCLMIESINKLLPVTQKSKTGHWIKKEDDTCWWYACSECEQEPLKNRWNDDDVLSAFCPNCGAQMESGDKE